MMDVFWQGLVRVNVRMLFMVCLFALALLAVGVAIRLVETRVPDAEPAPRQESGEIPAYRLEGAWEPHEARDVGNPFASVFLDTFYAQQQMREERAAPEPVPTPPPVAEDSAPEPEPAPAPPPPPSAVLMYRGLIQNTDGRRLALIEHVGEGTQRAYRLNDAVLPGRHLAAVERDRVILRDGASGTNRYELTVNEKRTVLYERPAP